MALAPAAAAATAAAAGGGLSSLIFLHGLGDSGAGWSFLRGELSARLPSLRFTFPNAPIQPVSLADGEAMPSWMDLDALPVTARTPEDRAGFEASTRIVHGLIDKEVAAGVAPNRIFLGGFSQGGAMSLYAGIKYPRTLGGIICFSGWLPPELWKSELAPLPSVAATKFLLVHGTQDSKVLFDRGTAARDLLTQAPAASVEFQSFRGDHTFYPPSLELLAKFIAE